ncbi:MAG TPA: hypothetical protein VNM66_06955, partial [Thermodesulfobacteriota bacterium]|nr:hypothetical protein [Thermodesulfobacteriota bacterium]
LERAGAPPLPEAEPAVAETADAVAEAEPAPRLRLALPERRPDFSQPVLQGFLADDDDSRVGIVSDWDAETIMGAQHDLVYVALRRGQQARPGDRFTVLRPGRVVTHPLTGRRLGRRYVHVGELLVTAVEGRVATAEVTTALEPLRRGDWVRALEPAVVEVRPKPGAAPVEGVIVEPKYEVELLSQHDFVYIDRGRADGVEAGHTFRVVRDGRRAAGDGGSIITPARTVGRLLVVAAGRRSATALVVESLEPLRRGDRIRLEVAP